jgi:hypothetical protein
MPITSVTVSSSGFSRAVNLDWSQNAPVSVSVVPNSSTSSGTFSLQYTLDDVMLSSNPVWQGVSSAQGQAATVWTSSTAFPDGVNFQFPTPVGAVRLSASNISSGAFVMKVMQGGL